jgi:hypothetical protein
MTPKEIKQLEKQFFQSLKRSKSNYKRTFTFKTESDKAIFYAAYLIHVFQTIVPEGKDIIKNQYEMTRDGDKLFMELIGLDDYSPEPNTLGAALWILLTNKEVTECETDTPEGKQIKQFTEYLVNNRQELFSKYLLENYNDILTQHPELFKALGTKVEKLQAEGHIQFVDEEGKLI